MSIFKIPNPSDIHQFQEITPVPVAKIWRKFTNYCLYITFDIEEFRKFRKCLSCVQVLKTIT